MRDMCWSCRSITSGIRWPSASVAPRFCKIIAAVRIAASGLRSSCASVAMNSSLRRSAACSVSFARLCAVMSWTTTMAPVASPAAARSGTADTSSHTSTPSSPRKRNSTPGRTVSPRSALRGGHRSGGSGCPSASTARHRSIRAESRDGIHSGVYARIVALLRSRRPSWSVSPTPTERWSRTARSRASLCRSASSASFRSVTSTTKTLNPATWPAASTSGRYWPFTQRGPPG